MKVTTVWATTFDFRKSSRSCTSIAFASLVQISTQWNRQTTSPYSHEKSFNLAAPLKGSWGASGSADHTFRTAIMVVAWAGGDVSCPAEEQKEGRDKEGDWEGAGGRWGVWMQEREGDESGVAHRYLAGDGDVGPGNVGKRPGCGRMAVDNDFTSYLFTVGWSLRHQWGGRWRLALAFRIICAEGMHWFLRTQIFPRRKTHLSSCY